MKSKLEQKLDFEFEVMGIKPRIYHFTNDVGPFNGITIVDEGLAWEGARRDLSYALYSENKKWKIFFPATRILNILRADDIYGVAICDARDTYSRARGRVIGKGRLLKHLRELEK